MNSATYSFKLTERIRTRWLTSFFIFFIWHSKDKEILSPVAEVLIKLLFYALPLYYFAYIKRGTRFIWSVLIYQIFSIAFSIALSIFLVLCFPKITDWLILPDIGISIWFMIVSYKLYQFNKEHKIRSHKIS